MTFPVSFKKICTKCGACCRHPPWSPDKPCEMLTTDNLCRLYDVDGVDLRPPVCKTDQMYLDNFAGGTMTRTRWNQLNAYYCTVLQEQENVPLSQRVDLVPLGLKPNAAPTVK